MSTTEFAEVVVYSNWCAYDCYPGEKENTQIKAGDQLNILWPDGISEIVRVWVVESSREGSDMGRRVDIPIRTACVEVRHRGIKLLVPLREHGVKIRRLTCIAE